MRSLYLLVVLCLLASCNPQRRLGRLATAHPDAAAEVCARMFPVKENTTVQIRTVKGDTIRTPGIIRYVDCDSVIRLVAAGKTSTKYVRVECPPQTHVTDTIFRDSVVVKENTAAVVSARAQMEKASADAVKYETQRGMYLVALLLLAGYTVVRIILRMWLKINLP